MSSDTSPSKYHPTAVELSTDVSIVVTVLRLLGRAWFILVLMLSFITMYIGAKIIHATSSESWDRKCEKSMSWIRFCLSTWIKLCPWISYEHHPTSDAMWDQIREDRKKGGLLLMENHTSFLDGLMSCVVTPPDIVIHMRTLAKIGVFNAPIVGEVFRLVGHMPVHFTHSVKFTVDAEKQKAVTDETVRFLNEYHGILLFCPEGVLSRDAPNTILPLRRGSFAMAVQHNLPIYSMSLVGTHECWPARWNVGGLPTKIDIKLQCVRTRKEALKQKATTEDERKKLTVFLADDVREKMQTDVTRIYKVTGRDKFAPIYKARLEKSKKRQQEQNAKQEKKAL